ADPRGQGAILIILVHRGEVAPGRIATKILGNTGFEIDREPDELQQKKTRTRWRGGFSEARSHARRPEKEGNKSGGEEHAVRLIAGKILSCGNKRQKCKETYEKCGARPEVQR